MPRGNAARKTTIWLGNGDSPEEWDGYGFDVSTEDNMVSISAVFNQTDENDDLEVFIYRDLFGKLREVMDRIDNRFGEEARSRFRAEVTEDHIALYDGTEELAYWDHAEWDEDPSLTSLIAKAIHLGYTEGPDAIRDSLGGFQ